MTRNKENIMKMKTKTKGIIVFALALLMASSVGLAIFAGHKPAYAAEVEIGEIYRISGDEGFFDSAEVHKLYAALTGNEKAEFEDVQTFLGSTAKSVSDFNEGEAKGKPIYLTFGGIRWTAVYLSETKDGSGIALTLLEADQNSSANYWQADYRSATYSDVAVPANMYSTSYMRNVALNAGGEYATGQKTSTTAAQQTGNRYARFTMEKGKIANSLTEYLFKPSQIAWQEEESAVTASGSINGVYNRSNEAYGSVPNTGFYTGSFSTGDTNYSNWTSSRTTGGVTVSGDTNGAWKEDYVWLPSATELGETSRASGGINYEGLWHITKEQRTFGDKEYWTRSAYHASPAMAINFDRNGYSTSANVNTMMNVRACIHLNLPVAEKESQVIVETPTIVDENNVDTLKTNYTGANLSQTVAGAEGRYTQTLSAGVDSLRAESGVASKGFISIAGSYYNPIIYNGDFRIFGLRAEDMTNIASFTVSAASVEGTEVTYTREGDAYTAGSNALDDVIKFVSTADGYTTSYGRTNWGEEDGMAGYFVATNADTYTVTFTLRTTAEGEKEVIYCWSEKNNFSLDPLSLRFTIGSRPLAIEVKDQEAVYGKEVALDGAEGTGWARIGDLDFAKSEEAAFVTLNTSATATSPVGENVIWGRFAYIESGAEDLAARQQARRNYSVVYMGNYDGGAGTGSDGTLYEQHRAGVYTITPATITLGNYQSHKKEIAADKDANIFGLIDSADYQSEEAVKALSSDGPHYIWSFSTSYGTVGDETFSFVAALTDDTTNEEDKNDLIYQGNVPFGTITYKRVAEITQVGGGYTYTNPSSATTSNEGVTFRQAGDFIVFVTVTADNHHEFNGLMYVHISSADIRIEWKDGLSLTYEYGHFGTTAKLKLGEEAQDISLDGMVGHGDPTSEDLIKLLFSEKYIKAIYEMPKEPEAGEGDVAYTDASDINRFIEQNFKNTGTDNYRIQILFHINVGGVEDSQSSAGYYIVGTPYSLDIGFVGESGDTRKLSFATQAGAPIPFIHIEQYKLQPNWGETTTFTYDANPHTLEPQVTPGDGAGQKFFSDKVEFVTDNVSGTNVDTYTVTITGLTGEDAGNYFVAADNTTCSFTISPKTLQIVAVSQSTQYDGEDATGDFISTNPSETESSAYTFVDTPAGDEKVQITLALVEEEVIHAGTYKVKVASWTVTGGDADAEIARKNYIIELYGHDESGQVEAFTITPRTLAITLRGHTNTYGEEHHLNDSGYWSSGKSEDAHGFTFNTTTLLEADEARVRVALYYMVGEEKRYVYGEDGKFDGVGEYDIKAELRYWTGGADGNKLEVSNWEVADGSEDYVLNPDYVPQTFEITKREATVTVQAHTVKYGEIRSGALESYLESQKDTLVTFNGFLEGEKPSVTLTLSNAAGHSSAAGYLNAGSYTVSVVASENANYEVEIITIEKFVVEKLSLTLEVDVGTNPCTTTYGEEPDFTGITPTATGFLADEAPAFNFYLSETKDGEKADRLVITEEGGGKYFLCAEIKDDPNYIFTWSSDSEAIEWAISPRKVSVHLSGTGTSVYGEALTLESISKELDSDTPLASEDTLDTLNISYQIKDGEYRGDLLIVGEYDVTGVSANANYEVTFTSEGKYTVTKKPITVTIEDQTATYGTSGFEFEFDYDSTDLARTDDVADFEKAILLTVEGERWYRKVGSYHITGESTAHNYEVTFAGESGNDYGIVTITKKTLLVIISDAGTPYGANILTSDQIAEGYAKASDTPALSLVEWDEEKLFKDLGITFEVRGSEGPVSGSGVAQGTYAIAGIVAADCNYDVTFFGRYAESGDYQNKAGIYTVSILTGVTVQIKSYSAVYGEGITHSLTDLDAWITVSGLEEQGVITDINKDNEFLQITLKFYDAEGNALSVDQVKDAKTYFVKGECGNESIAAVFTEGTYTITPKAVTVNVDSISQIYGEADTEYEWSVADGALAYSETKEVLNVAFARDAGNNVGEYHIHGTSANSNYTVTFTEATYTIEKRPITVTVKDASSAYGDPLTILSGYATLAQYETESADTGRGLVTGDSLRIELVVLGMDGGIIPGDYEIVAKGGNENYDFTFKPASGEAVDNTPCADMDGFVHFGGDKSYTVTKRAVQLAITSTASYYRAQQATLSVTLAAGYSLAEADEEALSDLVKFFGLTLAVYQQGESDPADFNSLEAGVYEIAPSPRDYQPEKMSTGAQYYTLTFVPGIYTVLQLDSVVVQLNTSVLTAEYGKISAGNKLAELSALSGEYTVKRADGDTDDWTVTAPEGVETSLVEGWLTSLLTVSHQGGAAADAYHGLTQFTLELKVNIAENNWYGGKDGTYYLGVGNYAISGSVKETSLVVAVLPGTLRITPKTVTVTAPSVGVDVDKPLYYGNDDEKIPDVTDEMVDGLLSGDYLTTTGDNMGLDIVFTREAGTDAGTYKIIGSYNANQLNYTVNFVEGTYKITPRPVTVTITAQKQVYGDYRYSDDSAILLPTWEAPNLSAGDVFTMTFSLDGVGTLSSGRYLNVGKNTLTFVFAAGADSKESNYTFTFVYHLGEDIKEVSIAEGTLTGTVSEGYEVTPRPVSITFNDVTRLFGTVTAGVAADYADLDNTGNWLVTGLADSADVSELFSAGTVFSVNFKSAEGWVPVGTYDIEMVGTVSANYTVTFGAGETTPKFIIERTAVTFTIGGMQDRTYGDGAKALNDVWAAATKPYAAGSGYRMKAGEANTVEFCYRNSLFVAVTFPADFDFSDASALENFVKTLAVSFYYTYTGASGDEVPAATLEKIPAGQYDVRLREGDIGTSYTVSVQNGSLLVKPKDITVEIGVGDEGEIGKIEEVYGSVTFSSSTTDETYWRLQTGSTLAYAEDDLQITLTRTGGSAAGDYPVTGASGNVNYNVTFVSGTYTILPKSVTVTIHEVETVYGETPEFTWDIAADQLVGSDNRDGLGVTLSVKGGNPNTYNHYNVGDYQLTLTWTNLNYTVVFTEAAFVVTAKKIEAAVENASITYGDARPEFRFTAEAGQFPEGESANVLSVNYTVAGMPNQRGFYDVQTYEVTAENTNPNYTVTFKAGQLTVGKKAVTITISDISGVYGTAKNDADFLNVKYAVSGGFAAGENAESLGIAFTLGGSVEKGALLDAGQYGLIGSLSGTEGFSAANYDVTFVGNYEETQGLVTVAPKPIEVVLKEEIKVLYGVDPGTEVFLPANVISPSSMEGDVLKGLVAGDAWDSDAGIRFTFSVNTETTLSALGYGAYSIRADVSGARKSNYTFTFTTSNYFVCAIGLNVFLYNVEDAANIYGTFESNEAFNRAYIEDAKSEGENKIRFIYFDPEDPDKEIPDDGFPEVGEFTFYISDYAEGANLAVGRHSIVAEFRRDVNYQVNIVPGTYIVYPAPIEITIEFASDLARAGVADKYTKVYDGKDVTLGEVTTESAEIVLKNGQMVGEDKLTFTLTKAPGANVGEYVIVIALKNDPANVLLASNYHITYGTGIYRITPRPVTVAIADQNAQYGSVALDGAQWSTEGGLVEGEAVSVLGVRLNLYRGNSAVADADLSALPVGSYAIVGSWTNTNYAVTFTGAFSAGEFGGKAGVYEVKRREVELFADSGTSVYGDEVTVPTWHLGTLSSVLEGELEEFEKYIVVSIEGYTAGKLSAGSHPVTVTYDSKQAVYANYQIKAAAGTYTVTKRSVTVSVDSITETVGISLEEVLAEVTSNVSGAAEGDELHFVYTVLQEGAEVTEGAIPTGTYILHADLAEDARALGENYQINYSYGSLFIVNSNGIVVVVDPLTSVYGDALIDLEKLNAEHKGYTVMGANEAELEGIIVTLHYDESVRASIKGVGTYENAVYAEVTGVGENYTIVKGTYTVTAKQVTVTIEDITQVYGEEEEALVWTITEGGLAAGDENDALGILLQRVPGDTVGDYAIVGTSSAQNYAVTFRSETGEGATGTYTITHRKITVETQNASSVYGDPIAALTAQVVTGEGSLGLKEGDSLDDLSLKVEIDAVWNTYLPYKAGGYKIVCRTSGTVGNYEITVRDSGIYTVEKREVTVTAQDALGIIYGTELGPFSYTLTGELAYGEQLQVAWAIKDHAMDERLAVGDYTILCSFASVTSSYEGYEPTADNYEFFFEEGALRIDRRTANVVLYRQSCFYGDNSFNTALGTAYTVSGLLSGDDLGLRLFPVDAEGDPLSTFDVGTYSIMVTGHNDNYDVVVSEGVYEIVKRVIEVEIENKTSIYGDERAELTFRVNGSLVAGDTMSDLAVELLLSESGNLAAGSYQISGRSTSEKYDVRFVNGTYTVEKRTVEVVIDDKSSFYGDPLAELTFHVVGELPAGDDVDDLYITLTSLGSNLAAGSHIIAGTSDSRNYNVIFHNGVYIVSRAANAWETYFSITGWMEGDPVGAMVAAKAKYGEVIVRYFTDSACTQAYEGTLADAKAGTYYAQVYVEDTDANYSGLTPIVYEFRVAPMPSIGIYVVFGIIDLVSLAVLLGIAVHFGRKKRK